MRFDAVLTFPSLLCAQDIGHGVLLLAALFLCLFERRLEARRRRGELGEILEMIFGGRYILLSMSLFAIYCGCVYNDTN